MKHAVRTALALLSACFSVAPLAAQTKGFPPAMHTPTGNRWTDGKTSFKGGFLRIIAPATLSDQKIRLRELIVWADRGMVTTNPREDAKDGFIKPGDVIVATNNLLLWFDATNDGASTTNGGGGLLRGLWPLKRDADGGLIFRRMVNAAHYYAPNLFIVGCTPGQQGSGISLLGNYGPKNVENGVTWAIEHEANPVMTGVTGKSIAGIDHGRYADRDGVFIQFTGRIANSMTKNLPAGVDSHYDVDFRPGQEGRARYTLTYRIPASGDEFRQEISLRGEQGQFGPLATIVLSHNLAGYSGQTIHRVSDPPLNGDLITQGKIVRDATPRFVLNGEALNFYRCPYRATNPPVTVEDTTQGEGRLLGIGAPEATPPVPFLVFRPDAARLPADLRSTFSLQAIDNRATDARCNAADWQLFDVNRGHPARVYSVGQGPDIVTDYALY